MKYKLFFENKALEDIKKITRSGNKPIIMKLDTILEELKVHPYDGTGSPEELKYNLAGFWSRRLSKKDRLIYQIIDEPDNLVVIVAALGHY